MRTGARRRRDVGGRRPAADRRPPRVEQPESRRRTLEQELPPIAGGDRRTVENVRGGVGRSVDEQGAAAANPSHEPEEAGEIAPGRSPGLPFDRPRAPASSRHPIDPVRLRAPVEGLLSGASRERAARVLDLAARRPTARAPAAGSCRARGERGPAPARPRRRARRADGRGRPPPQPHPRRRRGRTRAPRRRRAARHGPPSRRGPASAAVALPAGGNQRAREVEEIAEPLLDDRAHELEIEDAAHAALDDLGLAEQHVIGQRPTLRRGSARGSRAAPR